MEKYLKNFDKSIQFTEKLDSVETECEVKFEGTRLYKHIMILVRKNHISLHHGSLEN